MHTNETKEIQKQLVSYCQREEIAVNPVANPNKEAILKSFISGYIMNTAFLQLDGSYRTWSGHHVQLYFIRLTVDCCNSSFKCPI